MRSLLPVLLALTAVSLAACSTESSATTTTNPAPLASLQLANDGLGDVLFGLDPETVVSDISALFGAPDHDSLWIPAEPNIYGTCPGETMRAIGWGSLVAIFVDDGQSELGGFFYTYTYGYDYSENAGGIDPRGLNLETESGIGLGTTLADAESAFGDLTITGDEELDVWSFAAEEAGFRGLLTGPNGSDTITLIEPMEGCG